MRRSGGQAARLECPTTRDVAVVRAVPGVALLMGVVAVCLIAVSLFDMEKLRDFLDRLTPDGEMKSLDQFSNALIVSSLRELAIMTAAIAVMLWAFKRRLVRFLANPSTTTAGAGYVRIAPVELVVASGVFVSWVVIATSALSLPLRGDEAHTFLAFASRSFWIAWSHYSAPNNHVLHSLLVHTAYLIGGWNLTVLRLPAFLAACVALPTLWWFVRQEHGWLAAALATALLATSPLYIEYAANARGYTLLILFFLLSLLCGRGLVRRPDANELWMLQALIISLGFLTTPLMVFPAAITMTWMLILRYREGDIVAFLPFACKTVLWSCITLAITLLLYTPVLVVSGVDALFNHPDMKGGAPRYASIGYFLISWIKWHGATPLWAEAALLVMIVMGTATPRLPTGYRGAFATAVMIGTSAVLLVKPVVLPPRMTIFLLSVMMILAGTGAAFLIEAVLGRLRGNAVVLDAARAVIVLLVLGGFAWWATRPGVAERFAVETGFSPTARALTASILHDLRSGDFVVVGSPACAPVEFYLRVAGRNFSRVASNTILSINKGTRTYQIEGVRSDTAGRGFLIVDQAAYNALLIQSRRLVMSRLDERTARRYLEGGGYDYQVVADLPGGKVYRFVVPTPD